MAILMMYELCFLVSWPSAVATAGRIICMQNTTTASTLPAMAVGQQLKRPSIIQVGTDNTVADLLWCVMASQHGRGAGLNKAVL